jgi:FAD/FMN-containing dehydrogenase
MTVSGSLSIQPISPILPIRPILYSIMLPSPPAIPFHTDERARAAYSEGAGIYRIEPAAVAVPRSVEDLRQLLAWAVAEKSALIPRGAGSAMGGGNVGAEVIVDLTAMEPRTLTVDGPQQRADTSSGITWEELRAAASQEGLRLPPDPSSGRWATLGGMVSTNASGARTVRYGSVRPWVQGLTLLTTDGETVRLDRGRPAPTAAAVRRFESDAAPAIRAAESIIRSRFPHTRKNSSGYALDAWLKSGDLLDLIIGSEGTLALVTGISWRLDRVPVTTAALRVSLSSLDQLADAVGALLDHRPSAVEMLDRTFLELVAGRAGMTGLDALEAVLLVEFEADSAEAARAVTARAEAAVSPFAVKVETALDDGDVQRVWALRHAASPILAQLPESRRSLQVIEDGCVPVAKLGEYVRAVREAAERHALEVVLFGHAGDGHLHCNLLPDVTQEGWESRVSALLADVTDVVVRLGGTPSGEHGDGRLRAPLLPEVFGDEIMELFALVKRAFDPHGILNPGIKLGSAPPVEHLKVGSHAAPIPSDIARSLRDIERNAGYAVSRMDLA